MTATAKTKRQTLFLLSCLLLVVLTSGCVLPAPRSDESSTPRDVVFVPPTLVPTALPTTAATRVIPQTATPCVDSLSFISDVTIPDGTEVAPAASVDKRWEVENSGTCNWGNRYRLKLVAGPEMGAKTAQALNPARSGARATLRIQFTAPEEPGTYRSAWQAFNPDGQPFGDAIYIEIVVK